MGGGSNAAGIFSPFVKDKNVKLIGVEAAGCGVETEKHSATLFGGKPGVLHGAMSYLLQDDDGQIMETHSISAGLDYPGVGPEHSYFKDTGRVIYTHVDDRECLDAFKLLCEMEGIMPALESSHAVAHAVKLAKTLAKEEIMVINLSGRGDKDTGIVAGALGVSI